MRLKYGGARKDYRTSLIKLNLDEAFVDATFASAKKRAAAIGPTRRDKGTKIVAIAPDNSLPLAVSVESASPTECK